MEQYTASHSLVEPGDAVRLVSSIEDQSIAQGDTVLLRVQGIDIFENLR